MADDIRISSDGLSEELDPARWAKWRKYLKPDEQAIYLAMRQMSLRNDQDPVYITVNQLGSYLGTAEAKAKYKVGAMSPAAVVRALRGLAKATLLNMEIEGRDD